MSCLSSYRAVFPKGGREIHEELMSWWVVGDGKNPLLQWTTTWSQRRRVQDGLIEVTAIAIESCKDLLVLHLSHTTCFWGFMFDPFWMFSSIWFNLKNTLWDCKTTKFYKVANWRLLIDPHCIFDASALWNHFKQKSMSMSMEVKKKRHRWWKDNNLQTCVAGVDKIL